MMICFLLNVSILFAQNITVKGNVISSEDKLPVIGASVQVDGTTLGTITDFDGNFILTNIPSTEIGRAHV